MLKNQVQMYAIWRNISHQNSFLISQIHMKHTIHVFHMQSYTGVYRLCWGTNRFHTYDAPSCRLEASRLVHKQSRFDIHRHDWQARREPCHAPLDYNLDHILLLENRPLQDRKSLLLVYLPGLAYQRHSAWCDKLRHRSPGTNHFS